LVVFPADGINWLTIFPYIVVLTFLVCARVRLIQVWCAWGEMELRQAEQLSQEAEAAAAATQAGQACEDDPEELAAEAAAGYQAALEVSDVHHTRRRRR
jgi:hypothetical protein